MKTLIFLISLCLMLGAAACSQLTPISRDQLVENLGPMLRLEKRADQVKYYTQMLVLVGKIDEGKFQDLKAHHDVYFTYYLAANVALAGGNMESYRVHLKLAEKEMNSMEAELKNSLATLGESDSDDGKSFSRSGL